MPLPVLGLASGVFVLTAALEGVITVAVVAALERMNPKWTAGGGEARPVLAALGLAALVLAVGGFLVASALPDGLERVAGLVGLEGKEQVLLNAPLPDYEAVMVENPWVRKAGAGLIGLAITFVVCLLAGRWFARWRNA